MEQGIGTQPRQTDSAPSPGVQHGGSADDAAHAPGEPGRPRQQDSATLSPSCGGEGTGKLGADGSCYEPAAHTHPVASTSAHYAAITLSYPEHSLLVLRKSNPLRKACVYTINNPWFDRFILLMILGNCLTLAMSSNREGFEETALGNGLGKTEMLWIAVFTLEMVLKVVAMGFALRPGSYLRDGWNVLDFVVVCLGFVDLFSSGNLTAIRTVRVLRALRTITRIRGMRVLVETMIRSLPMLLDVALLCAFTFFIFGIVAVQLFAGQLRYRCAEPVFDNAELRLNSEGQGQYFNVAYAVPDDQQEELCSGPLSADTTWFDVGGTPFAHTGSHGTGRVCPAGTYCTMYGNPIYGFVNFDHILWAWLTIFQCITQEAWTDDMYFTQDAINYWVWLFYFVLIAFGSFFLVNLALAVLYIQFNADKTADDAAKQAAEEVAKQQQEQGQQQQQQVAKGKETSGDGLTDVFPAAALVSESEDEDDWHGDKPAGHKHGDNSLQKQTASLEAAALETAQAMAELPPWRQALYRAAVSKPLEYTTVGLIVVNTAVMCINWYGMPESVESATNYINYALTVYFLLELLLKLVAMGFRRYFKDGMNIFDCIVVATSVAEMIVDLVPSASGLGPLSVLRTLRLLRVFRLARQWKELNLIIKSLFRSVKSTIHLSLLMLLFMLIAALMGMQLFGYKFQFCDYAEGARPHCPLGHKLWGGCPNHLNCYVDCSPAQLNSWIAAPGSRFNGVAYCQQYCAPGPDGSSSSNGGANATVCETAAMVGKPDVPRAQFDNIFWAMLSVFQLLTGENWNNVMYDGMRTTTPWAALYFIIVIIIGTYLVFNLFIAILLENFSGTFGDARDAEKAAKHPGGSSGRALSGRKGDDSESDGGEHDAEDQRSVMHSEVSGLTARSGGTDWLGSDRLDDRMDSIPETLGGSGHLHPLQHVLSGRRGQVVPVDFVALDGTSAPPSARGGARSNDLEDGRPGASGRSVQFMDGRTASGEAQLQPPGLGDVASRRASFLLAHADVRAAPDAVSKTGNSFATSIVRLVDSVRHVKRSEHLKKLVRGQSLFCLGPDNWLRWRCARIVHNTHFETGILVLIAASSVTLALDAPSLDRGSRLAHAIRIMDYIFTGAFALEAALKIVSWGFLFSSRKAYLRNGWNILDFVIVIVGFLLIILEQVGASSDNLAMLRVLRTLRALRPLRAASRYEGLRAVVNALFAVLPAMLNVALVCLLFYLIFAIMGVNLFKGTLFSCQDAASGDRIDPYYVLPAGATLTEQWCTTGQQVVNASAYHSEMGLAVPSYSIATEWVNPTANFDNVGGAMLTLFQAATLELWVDIMYTGVDGVAAGKQPVWNNNPLMVLYFILFIAIGSFFVLNLFVGVTLDKFTELQEQQSSSSLFIAPQQQQWIDVQKLLLRTAMQLRPLRPDGPPWRERLYDIVTGHHFDVIIMSTIIINVVFMAMVHSDMTQEWQDCMSYSNALFTVVFLAEAAMKLSAFGPWAYFRDKWNSFDFFVVLISVASVILDFSAVQSLSFMPVLRVLRVVRVVRLIKRARGLQRLLTTLVYSLPALGNVGSVMLLFFFIWGVVGMNLFGGIKRTEYLSRHNNFDSFPAAILVLFRMLTGESWDGIMQDCMIRTGCVLVKADTVSPATNATLLAGEYYSPKAAELKGVPSRLLDNQCTLSPAVAIIYFISFIIVCAFILLNLVIAVILENMMTSENDEGLPVARSWLAQFVDAWSEEDSAATGFIPTARLTTVVGRIEAPMGTKGDPNARASTQALIMSVDIPNHPGNMVSFMEALHALSGRVCGTELPEIEEDALTLRFGKRRPHGGHDCPKYTAAHFHAALYVQAAVRGFMARHRMRGLMQTLVPSGGEGKPAAAAKDKPGGKAE